jgi:predicted metal-dependent peptidase
MSSTAIPKTPDHLGSLATSRRIQGNPFTIQTPEGPKTIQVSPAGIAAIEAKIKHLVSTELCDDVILHNPGDPSQSIAFPRFGEYSLMMRGVTHVVYDAPELLQLCDNAFTDGHRIWWSVPLALKLMRLDEEGSRVMLHVAMHEIGHILLAHHRRFAEGLSDNTVRQAIEIENNSKMARMFPEVHPGDELAQILPGYRDADKWADLSAEEIREIKVQEQASQPQQGQGQGQPGKGQGQGQGQPDAGQGQPGQGQGQGQGQSGQGPARGQGNQPTQAQGADTAESALGEFHGVGRGEGHDDIITAEKVAEVLYENGYERAASALDIPRPADQGAMERQRRLSEGFRQSVFQEGNRLRQEAKSRGCTAPGAHMESYYREMVRANGESKMKFRMAVRRLLLGTGQHSKYRDHRSSQLYHVDPAIMGVKSRVYLGVNVAIKPQSRFIAIADTSGSVDSAMLGMFFDEIFGTVRDTRKANIDMSVYMADTVVRGDPLEVTPKNWRSLLNDLQANGRGGTDFANALIHTYEMEKKAKRWKSVEAILYYTDLLDHPPTRDQIAQIRDLPPVIFVVPPGMARQGFANAVSSWAKVLPINATTVDLERIRKEIKAGAVADLSPPGKDPEPAAAVGP